MFYTGLWTGMDCFGLCRYAIIASRTQETKAIADLPNDTANPSYPLLKSREKCASEKSQHASKARVPPGHHRAVLSHRLNVALRLTLSDSNRHHTQLFPISLPTSIPSSLLQLTAISFGIGLPLLARALSYSLDGPSLPTRSPHPACSPAS